jgi:aryl-alcohol dehydrogenase-like predicted oxidoreductase
MEQRQLGSTGIVVSQLGFGTGNIGTSSFSERECEELLNSVVDLGINLIDSARSYGLAEERIGRYLKARRDEIVLSTKVGYGIPGYQDWTPECIEAGVDAALQRFQTDRIDIVHFHSCPAPVLLQEGLIEALLRAVENGKIRVAAYSGDNEPFDWALTSGKFASLQTSINICDQRSFEKITSTRNDGVGIVAKRSLANAAWLNFPRPNDQAAEEYRKRWQIMNLGFPADEAAEFALRFVAFLPGVHSCLIASTKLEHVRQNVAIVERGPLAPEMQTRIREAFGRHRSEWPGMI